MSDKEAKTRPPPPPEKGAWERIRQQVEEALDALFGPRTPAPEPIPLRVRRR